MASPDPLRQCHSLRTARAVRSPQRRHQDVGGATTGGTEGQPARTFSTTDPAACSTALTEAAIFPRFVDKLSCELSPVMVSFNDAMALSSSAICGPNCSLAAVARSL